MKTITEQLVLERRVTELVCDRCGRHCGREGDEIYELQEFLQVDYEAGYGSIFPDESRVSGDFCQHCVKELLGPWLRIE